ncbi:MAG: Crp/Fnr family transcriptional regulator [Gammaproteobacteria bacterium]
MSRPMSRSVSARANVVSFPKHTPTCGSCLVHDVCPLAAHRGEGLDADEQAPGAAKVLRSGEHLFRMGDRFESVYVVRSGAFKTYRLSTDGEERVVGLYGPGDVIGLDAIGAGEQVCNAMALDVSTVCFVPFERLARQCADSPTYCRAVLEAMSAKIAHDETQLIHLGQKNADQRVAAFIVEQVNAVERRGQAANEILLTMSRSDIASYLAMAVETVSRTLTKLQNAGVLAVSRNLITICDAEALKARAEGLDTEARRAAQI